MAQNLAQFTSLGIDDLPRFFQDLWPQFTASTKKTLLAELRPYLSRWATLLTDLEPQLFSTRTTQKRPISDSLVRLSCSAPKPSLSAHREVSTPTFQSSSAPASGFTAASPALGFTTTLSATSLSPLRPILPELSTAAPASIVTSKFLPGLPSDVEKLLCNTTAESFFQRQGKASSELYSALCRSVDNLWLNVIEQRFRYLGLYYLQCRLTERGDGDTFYFSPLSAKKRIIDAAVRYNPNVSKEKVRHDITKYLERGKKYRGLMDKFSAGLVASLDPDYINLYERRMTKADYEQFISELTKGRANIHQSVETAAQQLLDCICRQCWAWLNDQKRKRGPDTTECSRETGSSHYQTNKRRRSGAVEIDDGHGNDTISTTLESFLPSPNHYLDVLAYTALSGAAAQNCQPLHTNAPASHFAPNLAPVTNTIFNHFSGNDNTNAYNDSDSFGTRLNVNVNAQAVNGTLYYPNTLSADTNNDSGPFGNELDINVNAQAVNGTLYYPNTLAADTNNDSGPFGNELDINVNAQAVNGTLYYPNTLSADTNNDSGPFGNELDINVNAQAVNGTLYYPNTLSADTKNDSNPSDNDLDINVNAQVVNGTTYDPGLRSAGTNNNWNSFGADLDVNVNAHAVHGTAYYPDDPLPTPAPIPIPCPSATTNQIPISCGS